MPHQRSWSPLAFFWSRVIGVAGLVAIMVFLGWAFLVGDGTRTPNADDRDARSVLEKLARTQARMSRQVDALRRSARSQHRRLAVLEDAIRELREQRDADASQAGEPAPAADLTDLWEEVAQLRTELESRSVASPAVTFFQAQPLGAELLPGQLPELPVTTGGSNPGVLQWGAEQVLGAPDTDQALDLPTAWASRDPDGGDEWLVIGFTQAVRPDAIVVRESFNPGAVVAVEAMDAYGEYHEVWRGRDPTRNSPADFVIPYGQPFPTQVVRITLDTSLVGGWNEIDAVGLRSGDHTDWGALAEASSSYADNYAR